MRFLRLQFTDVLGMPRTVAIPADQAEKPLTTGIGFDGSSKESDMLPKPDLPPTPFSWLPHEDAVARFVCNVTGPGGRPFAGDPCCVLRRGDGRRVKGRLRLQHRAGTGWSTENRPSSFRAPAGISTLPPRLFEPLAGDEGDHNGDIGVCDDFAVEPAWFFRRIVEDHSSSTLDNGRREHLLMLVDCSRFHTHHLICPAGARTARIPQAFVRRFQAPRCRTSWRSQAGPQD